MGEVGPIRTPDTQVFRDVFNASPIGIAVEDLDGQPLFVNPAFCSFLGFTEEELRHKHCVDFSPPEDAKKDWELFQQLRAGLIDHYQLEKRYFRRNGSLVWGRLSLSILKSLPSPLVVAMVEDITDKKIAEEAKFRHAAIVESSEDAIASVTLDGVIVTWNGGARRIFGYTESEAVGKSVAMLVPPERPDEESEILRTLNAGGRIDQLETVRVTKTGKRINVSLSISPIKDSIGQTVGFSGISRDITERKRAEEALRASAERLQLAQQAARVGTFEWNVRTGLDTWTPELEAMHGLPPGSFGGTQADWEKLVHPDDLTRVKELMDEAFKTGEPSRGEWRVQWPDGSVHWIVGRWQTFNDETGEPSRVVGVNIDVTERKQAEEALLKAKRTLEAQTALLQSREELLKIFVKNVPAGVAMLDRDMRYLQVSDRFCLDYGIESSQVLGCSHYDVFPDVPERWKQMHRRALEGEMLRADEDPWDRNGGSTAWVRWEILPWRTESGIVGGILIFTEDITQRKQTQQALSEISRKLIQSQEEERARIGRELHDDINQRLAMLALELQQLQENPSEVQDRARELRRQTVEISHDVQALSHELHSSKLEYLGVVAGIRSWCKEFGEHQGMEISFRADTAAAIPAEIGVTLFRVLQEALHNAVKHSGMKRIKVELLQDSNELHLTISDTGKGFDVEAAKRGSGLGLASMEERVRLVNGTIDVESRSKAGTTIRVRVPFASAHRAERAAG